MLAILVCIAALLVTWRAGKKSLGHGIVAVLSVGYFYGIVRANIPTAASHFIFDCSVLGLYASQRWGTKGENGKQTEIQTWALVLMIWPLLLCLLPFQNFWVTMVGLRGNILFLPFMFLGCRLKDHDLRLIAKGVAVLTLIGFGFGVIEYFEGIERFYPVNEVTQIIYKSNDVAGNEFRIPAIFTNAHAYGGTMFISIPWLFGAWSLPGEKHSERWLYMIAMAAAFTGVLLSATRTNFILVAILVLMAALTSRVKLNLRLSLLAVLFLVAVLAANNERLQRFTTLTDTGNVGIRVQGSVNQAFWEILSHHPMGNGLGGGGTSMPYFLQNQVQNPIGMENEYARILSEQGLIGLMFWISLVLWHLLHRSAFKKTAWMEGRKLAWWACTCSFGIGFLGTGLLTAIPETPVLLLFLGWISTPVRKSLPGPQMTSVLHKRPDILPLPSLVP
jgi:hypothetical protein